MATSTESVRLAKLARLAKPVHITKHSLLIAGHRTSISLEDAFWSALRRLAAERDQSIAALVAAIDAERGGANLSSAIRVYLLETFMVPVLPEA